MPTVPDTDSIRLAHLSEANLRRLAAGEPLDLGPLTVAEGALPPPKTVARALAQLALATPGV